MNSTNKVNGSFNSKDDKALSPFTWNTLKFKLPTVSKPQNVDYVDSAKI